jgi:glycosyltransferase involved in cell wall biosynthesis
VRDVAIAREHDFETGTPVSEEATRVDLFFSPSAYVTASLQKWGIDAEKIREVPFGVDTDIFRPVADKPQVPLRFAFVGAVNERKGVPTLLRVWRRLQLPQAELHLYGTVKPEVASLLSARVGVHAHGRTSVADKLPHNHVFVFPSTREGSSKAVYEALACGLPVVTTPNAGSVVRHEVDGLIVPPDDEDALAEALKRLYEEHSLRRAMAHRARMRAEEYPWERYATTVWRTYAELKQSTKEAG